MFCVSEDMKQKGQMGGYHRYGRLLLLLNMSSRFFVDQHRCYFCLLES